MDLEKQSDKHAAALAAMASGDTSDAARKAGLQALGFFEAVFFSCLDETNPVAAEAALFFLRDAVGVRRDQDEPLAVSLYTGVYAADPAVRGIYALPAPSTRAHKDLAAKATLAFSLLSNARDDADAARDALANLRALQQVQAEGLALIRLMARVVERVALARRAA